ncbi:MAG: DUF3558 domain-containing protein [Salinisphaera sp.]|nr:DUF3558 domain-containing protein [Salinisphaera sp.]
MSYRKQVATSLVVLFSALALSACGGGKTGETAADTAPATSQPPASQPAPAQPKRNSPPAAAAKPDPVCANCGTITSIEKRQTQGSRTSKEAIIGSVVGAVAGVMLGQSQFSGDEEGIATAAGGVAGAAAGNEIGRRIDKQVYYAVTVDMEAGGSKVITVPDASGLSVGQQVKVNGSNIVLQ